MAAVVEPPGSLALTIPAVANMMRRWNYREGWGLGARGQGIVAPIKATERCPKAGIGHGEEPYDNGLAAPPPPRKPSPEDQKWHEWQKLSRALLLEQECCDKIISALRDMRHGGGDSAETANALAVMVRSKKVFFQRKRKPGTWKAALPPSVTRYVVDHVITPAMAVDAGEWEPSWDPGCRHWLRPLIPIIGHLPRSLYGVVESKIANRGYGVVSPWKEYLDPTLWDVFSRRHVVPKLARLVRELRVTPPKQVDSSFRTVMLWAPLARAEDVVSMLEAELFFDKWKGVLRHWLLAARPPLAEATAWCNGWKNLFAPELLADESVLKHLEEGLAMVDRAAAL
ncbi:septin and tuftelin-interacting protein 1 homolog 1-like [Lolium rigidum]|uniref:septin and tuftelin-interacting protein 1 homolog 1-like n=1 Tax=Lolium rigidum TaxID=89674 RepID=UPI001F5E04B4|nr:septin and tuftelin-interacting protein 1 homolog 1-like [Lolium rigidum]